MLVLGIDPGTAATGYGLVTDSRSPRDTPGGGRPAGGPESLRLIECGVIRTRPADLLPVRLQEVYRGVCELIARHRPDALSVEDIFYSRNARTSLTLGHARGVVLLAAAEGGLAVWHYPPSEIKKAIVGTGAATKEQVQFMLTRLLRLTTAPQPADASDGVAAAVTCLLSAHLQRLPTGASLGAGAAPRAGTRGTPAARRRRSP